MESALAVMRRAKTVDKEWRDADEQFNAALLDASSNIFLVSMTASINTAMSWSTIYKQREGPLRRDPEPDHRRVYRAIERADPAAAREAMARLVDLALNDIKAALKPHSTTIKASFAHAKRRVTDKARLPVIGRVGRAT
jgi:DNA-binding FadR family transcriptional regulator